MQFYIQFLLQHTTILHTILFQLLNILFTFLNVVCEITRIQYFYSPGFAHTRVCMSLTCWA